jgi:CBS domain containing-hemolysin-like protein
MFDIIIMIVVISLMILATGLYVAAEFATVSARRTRINQMAGSGNRLAQQLLPIMEDSHALDDYVAACQVGILIQFPLPACSLS